MIIRKGQLSAFLATANGTREIPVLKHEFMIFYSKRIWKSMFPGSIAQFYYASLLRMLNAILGGFFSFFFSMSSLISFSYCSYRFRMRFRPSLILLKNFFGILFIWAAPEFSYFFRVRLFPAASGFSCLLWMSGTPFANTRPYLFGMRCGKPCLRSTAFCTRAFKILQATQFGSSTFFRLTFFRRLCHPYFILSRLASLRTVSSKTAVMLIPFFSASRRKRRFASSLSRRLIACDFFMTPLYNTITVHF